MSRFGMISLALAIGLILTCLVLILYVDRPPECGEPSACGNEHLFPALPVSDVVFFATVIYAVLMSNRHREDWPRHLKHVLLWSATVATLLTLCAAHRLI